MPSRKKPAAPVVAEDIVEKDLAQEEIESAQALPEGELVKVEPVEENARPEGSPHPVQCKYAGDPMDENCAECDGWDPVGQINDKGFCVVYEEGPAPKDWQAYYSEVEQKETTPPETSKNTDSLADRVQESLGMGASETATIQAEISITEQVKKSDGMDLWIKCGFSEVRRIAAGSDLQAEKDALWADVKYEVEREIEEQISKY